MSTTSKPLTLKKYLQKIIEHRIKVVPVLEKSKDGKDKIIGWQAGKRSLSGDGWTNIVNTDDFVTAPDPVTAVSVLVRRLEERKP